MFFIMNLKDSKFTLNRHFHIHRLVCFIIDEFKVSCYIEVDVAVCTSDLQTLPKKSIRKLTLQCS